MQRDDLRKLAVKTADSIIDGFSNTVKRAAGLFESPEEALKEFFMPEINRALGFPTDMYPLTALYTGEIRDIEKMLNARERRWTATFALISDIAKRGQAVETFKPGDYILIPVSVRETEIDGVEFPGINDAEAKLVITQVYKNRVIFNFENVLFHAPVNHKDTNEGGFKESTLAKYLNGHFLKSVFSDVLSCLTPNHDGLRVSIPTRFEVFGNGDDKTVNWGDAERLSYFAKCTNRIKVDNKDQDNTNWWWLYTASHSTNFCLVYHYGNAYSNLASNTDGGVSPAICVS